jgi:hypothetical protein
MLTLSYHHPQRKAVWAVRDEKVQTIALVKSFAKFDECILWKPARMVYTACCIPFIFLELSH